MTRKKIIKTGLLTLGVGIVIAGAAIFYIFNMPHRDIQSSPVDFQIEAASIVNEYLNNPEEANQKYLDEEGESKIFVVTGEVASISEDFNRQKVVLLKSPEDQAGVSCTFTKETNGQLAAIEEGQIISVKGVIRSGAAYDDDLGMYENVILEKCSIIKIK